jgi:hypothetical protein
MIGPVSVEIVKKNKKRYVKDASDITIDLVNL